MPIPLIGTGRRDRFPKEDVRLRRGLASTAFVPFIGANQDVDLGAFSVTALRFFSTVTTLSLLPPFVVASTVVVTNLNADMVNGLHAADFTLAGLADVTIFAVSDGQMLAYSSGFGKWVVVDACVPYTGATGTVDLNGQYLNNAIIDQGTW
jgi:hypothetical protein